MHIESGRWCLDEGEYLYGDIEEEEEEEEEESNAAAASADPLSSEHLKQLLHSDKEQSVMEVRAALQRMRTALTHSQPTQRSREVRLALADWLHRRLRRGKLQTDSHSRHKPLLRRYRN